MKLFGPRYPEDREAHPARPEARQDVARAPRCPIPDFDESTWNLEVNGLVDNPYSLTYAELKALGPVDVQADMHCVTGWSTLDNTWTGVPFRVLAEKAGVQEDAKWVIAHCDYGYTSDLSLQAMLDDDVLVAWAGGEPLTGEHGFPLRLVVPKPMRGRARSGCVGSSSRRRTSVVLGGARLPHPRRALGGGAVLVSGRPRAELEP